MSQGWPVITTPIVGQLTTPVTITTPTLNQALVYNGTNWANATLTPSTTPTFSYIYMTADETHFQPANNTINLTSASASINLFAGTYMYWVFGSGTSAVAQTTTLGLTGTFVINSVFGWAQSIVTSGGYTLGSNDIAGIPDPNPCAFYGTGTITMTATTSITLNIRGNASAGGIVVVHQGTNVIFMKVS